MKIKRNRTIDLCLSDSERAREVQREIDNFLRALSSYPDRFTREPYLSFEQHLSSIVLAARTPGREEEPRS